MVRYDLERVKTDDESVRYAIWVTYGKKCFYTDEKLNKYADMELDHIIPKSLKGKPRELKKLLKKLDKDENFELDSLCNLVPVIRGFNRRKSDFILELPAMSVALNRANKWASTVHKEMKKFRSNIELQKNLSMVKSILGAEERERELEEIYDFLSNDNELFVEEKIIFDCGHYKSYYNASKNIMLDGFLPTYYKMNASCLLVFRTLRIRDCMITFNSKEILGSLFKGLYTEPRLALRGFIACPANAEKTKYYVQLGNNRFALSIEELEQLCNIIDDFANEYLSTISNVENLIGSKYFEPSKNEGAFRLLKIKRALWKRIVDFTYEFDTDKGNSEWHIFDSNSYMIKVYTSSKTSRYDAGYHTIISTEHEVNQFLSPMAKPSDEIWLTWTPLRMFDGIDRVENLNERQCWNAKTTYKWLTEEFIPYVLYYYSENKEKRLLKFFKRRTFQMFLEDFDLTNYIQTKTISYLKTKRLNNISELLYIAEKLQAFYSTPNQLFMKANELFDLYSGIVLILRYTPLNGYGYIAGNLGCIDKEELENIIEFIRKQQVELRDGVISSFKVDLLLRCIVGPLRDFESNLNEKEIHQIGDYLRPLINIYNRQLLISKYKKFKYEQ